MSTKNFVVLCSYFAQRLTIFVFGRALLVAISSSMMNFDPPRTVARGKLIWCTLSGKRETEAPQPACMERTYQDLKRKVSASRCFGSMLLGTEEIKKPTAPSSTASISNHGSSLVRRYQSQAPMGGCDGQLHPSYTNPLYDRLIPLYSLFPIPSHSNTLRSQSIATKVIRLLLYFGSTVSLNPWYYWLSRSRYNLCQARKASFLK